MKVKALLYCTKAKPILYNVLGKYCLFDNKVRGFMQNGKTNTYLNGKIVCECEVDTEKIKCVRDDFSDCIEYREYHYITKHLQEKELIKRSCLTNNELSDYLNTPTNEKKRFCDTFGYALHISNIKVFDKPRELKECYYYNSNFDYLLKAPQNMCYAFEPIQFDEINIDMRRLVLISVRPQWLCKILNGEKDIEVRKKVLKGMVD